MDSTTDSPSSGGPAAWQSAQAPCVYCGQVIDRTEDRCPHCRTSMSVAVRRASREVIGPWYYLDPRNPSGRGVTFEALIKMIEKGRIKADSIVRGPTTHQDWMYAAEAPRLAKYLGLCPHCFGEVRPEDTYCSHCQLNMNTRPAEPRPGVPESLVKPPVQKAAYDIERQLAGAGASPDATLEGQALDVPVTPVPLPVASVVPPLPRAADPAPMSAPAARPAPMPVPVARQVAPVRVDSTATIAAAAAVAAAGGGPAPLPASALAGAAAAAGERPSRVAAKRPRPKLWVVLALTWGTMLVLVLLVVYTPILPAGARDKFRGLLGMKPVSEPASTTTVVQAQPKPGDDWLDFRTKEADKAKTVRDYARARDLYLEIFNKVGDPVWRSRADEMSQKITEEAKQRSAKLAERLKQADTYADAHQYDDALAILRNISPDDRLFIASRGTAVDAMEKRFTEDRATWAQRAAQETQLRAALAHIGELRSARKNDEALRALRDIRSYKTYPQDLVSLVAPKIDEDIKDLDTLVSGTKVRPDIPVTPVKPPEANPELATPIIADLMAQADQLEKAEKLTDALAKLQEIQKRFPKNLWPEGLEARVRRVKDKVDALKFFLGGDPPLKTK
jgi:hypothetical protein